MVAPKIIFLFSGKRKSGKDYISEKLLNRLPGESATIIRLSAPLKREYAAQHGLDYSELLTASDYKERYRQDMIDWSEGVRARDPSYFITRAIDLAHGEKYAVWIVSDVRRKSDLHYFHSSYPDVCVSVLVVASERTRASRGWVFTTGVDDVASECDLDDITSWDHKVDTSAGDEETVNNLLTALLKRCEGASPS